MINRSIELLGFLKAAVISSLSLFAVCWVSDLAAANEQVDFEEVAMIFVTKCLECHSETEKQAGLILTNRTSLITGGESGHAIVPHNSANSLLLEKIESGEMPPPKKGVTQALAKHEVDLIKNWIEQGAVWPTNRELDLYERKTSSRGGRDWWAFKPIQSPPTTKSNAVPNSGDRRIENAIDSFVWEKLHDHNMSMAPAANKRQLLRRLYIDLIGFPPTFEQIEAFVRNPSPTAYEESVDKLLASHHFGERWARYWLDLVRYSETCGYERDQTKPFAWKYRDWVIDSINNDKPYDRFVLEQLAGDELPDRNEQSAIATGFIRLGTWNDEPNDPHEYKFERLEDMVHATSTTFLGLTVKCARCHDHKFDPIYQKDYYRLAAAFWAGFIEPGPRELLGGPSAEKLGFQNVFGWTDRSTHPPDFHLLVKGDPARRGEVVVPEALSTLPTVKRPFVAAKKGDRTSLRRLQFAEWIVDRNNPLTARVFVNRIWQHHFGKALVRTPNNFGFKGERPTHPKLLDWLAAELVSGGWKAKRIHKLIVMSETYRQASDHPKYDTYREADFLNRMWWRAERRRLDAEALRDGMLAASGQLNRKAGGPSFHARANPEALEGLSRKSAAWKVSSQNERNRRSVYMFTQRSLTLPLMSTFDFCDTTQPCGKRDTTTVAPQALALLNNQFVHEQSEALANRITKQAGHGQTDQATLAWRFVLGRSPSSGELKLSIEHLRKQVKHFTDNASQAKPASQLALASLCHVLFNSNEFLYVD